MNNTYNLEKKLINYFGDDIDIKPFAVVPEIIEGTYKEVPFVIIYKEYERIIFSIDESMENEINDFINIFSTLMNSKPICSYNVTEKCVLEGNYGRNMIFIEWDNYTSDKNIENLIKESKSVEDSMFLIGDIKILKKEKKFL